MNDELRQTVKRRRGGEPMRSYLWMVDLPSLPGLQGAEREVSSRVLSVSLPFDSIEADKHAHGNRNWYYGKSTDIGQMTIEIMEYEDGLTYQYLRKWFSMIENQNATYNPPAFYKKDIRFYRLNSFKRHIEDFTYHGFFPTGIGDLANDYESNNVLRYVGTFNGDGVTERAIAGVPTSQKQLKDIINSSNAKKSILNHTF